MTSREELIEKAAKTLYMSLWPDGDYERTKEFNKDAWRRHARAALAVFEEAHTPTDDEREALAGVLYDLWDTENGNSIPYLSSEARTSLAGGLLAAGFRRSEVPEPSAEHGPDWSDWGIDHPEEGPSCKCGYNGTPEECAVSRADPQGEQAFTDVVADTPAPEGCPGVGMQGELSDAQVAEIEQRVYDAHRGQIAGMAKALVRAGWDAALRAAAEAERGYGQ